MEGVLLAARLLLAGVFAVAGVAKLADRAGTCRAIVDFGAPERLASRLAVALPATELMIALAVLPRRTAWLGALAALALLLAFLAAIAFNLAKGRKPDCRCFGQLRAAPIGASTVVLNLGLIAIAGWFVWHGDPGPSFVAWRGELAPLERLASAVGIAALASLALLAWLAWRTLREQGRRIDALELRLEKLAEKPNGGSDEEGLPVGSVAPRFTLESLDDGIVTLDQLLAARKPIVLIFTELQCGPCEAMLPDIARWQRDHTNAMTIAVLAEGAAAANRSKSATYGLYRVLLQKEVEVADAYDCAGAPGAVLVRTDGTIGSPIAGGADQIERLVASIVGTSTTGDNRPAKARSLHILGRRGAGGR